MSVSKINFNDKNEAFIVVDPINEIDKDDFKKYLDLDSPYFLGCEFENDKVFTLFYAYESYITLKSLLGQTIKKNNVLALIKSLTQSYIEAEEEGLNTKNILLGVNSIFCHPETAQAACVYVPVVDGVLPERSLRMFLKELVVNIIYSDEEEMTWLGDLIRYINKNRQLNYKEFLTFLETLDEKNKSSEKVDRFDTDEIEDLKHILNPLPEKEIIVEGCEPEVKAYLHRRSDRSVYVLGKNDMHIGKAPSNEIFIKDNPVISRVHAIIRFVDGNFVILDNGSTNHTFVNGFVLQPNQIKVLAANDRILLGNEEFIFKI